MDDKISKAILKLAEVHDRRGEEIAEALNNISYNLRALGNGDAATSMGAIEGLAMMIKEGLESIGTSMEPYQTREGLEKVAEDIKEGLEEVASDVLEGLDRVSTALQKEEEVM